MKKISIALFILTTFVFAYSSKGMVTYKKLCSSCHGPAFKGAAMLESEEWENMFSDNAKKLKSIHKNDKEAMKKLKSKYFKRRIKDLKRFMMNNARDMGVVRSCDGLNCG